MMSKNPGNARLTVEQVRELKRCFLDPSFWSGSKTRREVADLYGVSPDAIDDIRKGYSWRWVGLSKDEDLDPKLGQQAVEGLDRHAPTPKGTRKAPIHDDKRQCKTCGIWKALSKFPPCSAHKGSGTKAHCRPCYSLLRRQQRQKYRDKEREYDRKRSFEVNYGITIEEYESRLERQNGVCLICSSPPTTKRLAVDHCHVTGEIRGLLCSKCNTALGLFNDSPELMKIAIEYLAGAMTVGAQ
jgi:hypothetical protein